MFTCKKVNDDSEPTTRITIAPSIGFFLINDFCVDINFSYSTTTWESFGNDYKSTNILVGLGGRIFLDKLYGGGGLTLVSYKSENGSVYESSGNFLYFNAGYLYPLVSNVYVDFGVEYVMGLGKYGEEMNDIDNEETSFDVGVGLEIFLK